MQHRIPLEQLSASGSSMAKAVESCVHCGFCLPACPTYVALGEEMDSPRGADRVDERSPRRLCGIERRVAVRRSVSRLPRLRNRLSFRRSIRRAAYALPRPGRAATKPLALGSPVALVRARHALAPATVPHGGEGGRMGPAFAPTSTRPTRRNARPAAERTSPSKTAAGNVPGRRKTASSRCTAGRLRSAGVGAGN